MARLNIDYKLERNKPTFRALQRKLQDEGAAWERLLRFMDIAQDWYSGKGGVPPAPPLSGISEDAFALEGDLECMIEVGYAKRKDDGIHSVCELDQFHWLLSKVKGGKGRAATARARNGNGTFVAMPIHNGSIVDPVVDPQRSIVDASAAAHAGQVLVESTSSQPACAGQVLVESTSSQPASSSLLLLDSILLKPSGNPQAARQHAETHSFGPAPPDPKACHFDKVHLELARWIFRQICLKNPKAEKLRFANPEKWANELRLAVETDGIPLAELNKVVRWAFNDRHWQMTIQSPSGLRRNWPALLERYNGRKESQYGQGEAPR